MISNNKKMSSNNISINGIFKVTLIQIKTSRTGKPYFHLNIQNQNRRLIALRFLDNTNELNQLEPIYTTGNILKIEGIFNEDFNNVKILREKLLQPNEYNQVEFVKPIYFDVSECCEILEKTIQNISNLYDRKLLDQTFKEPEFRKSYLQCPSSINHHHAQKFGNLRHITNMLLHEKLLAEHSENNSYIDRDLLRTAIIHHDIGKPMIYSINNDELVINKNCKDINHVSLGYQIILKNLESIKDYPKDRKNKLIHMIMSHHGKKKWGAIAEPEFPEAQLLHLLDLLDSRYNEFTNKIE